MSLAMGDISQTRKDLVVRLGIFMSLALAAGVSSFNASACTRLDDYNRNVTTVQQKYQLAVDAANKTYAARNVSTVVYVDRYVSGRRYNPTVVSYNMQRDNWQNWQNWQDWQKAVNAAMADYMTGAQDAYHDYLTTACWW
jgi:hypothetical protein